MLPTGLKRVALHGVQWLDDRTGVMWVLRHSMFHRVPISAKWWYVFGSATMMFFTVQVVSGIVLAMFYAPSAAQGHFRDAQGWRGRGSRDVHKGLRSSRA